MDKKNYIPLFCMDVITSDFPQKSQKKSSMIFPWLLQATIQISGQKKK